MIRIAASAQVSAGQSVWTTDSPDSVLIFTVSGYGIYSQGSQVWLLNPGTVFLSPKNTAAELWALTDWTYTELKFPSELAAAAGLSVPEITIRQLPEQNISGFMELLHELKNQSNARCIDSSAKQLLAFAGMAVQILHDGVIETSRQKKTADLLLFIHDNYQRDITLDDLAELSQLSRSQMRRQFTIVMKKSPIDYLLDYRLMQADILLTTTDKSIAALSSETGFNDPNYFSRAYTAKYHITPRDRRKNRKESK